MAFRYQCWVIFVPLAQPIVYVNVFTFIRWQLFDTLTLFPVLKVGKIPIILVF